MCALGVGLAVQAIFACTRYARWMKYMCIGHRETQDSLPMIFFFTNDGGMLGHCRMLVKS